MHKLFTIGKEVIQKIEKAGFEAYFVGGAVRDFIRQAAIHDIDITTNAKVSDIQAIFKRTISLGLDHGTIIVRHQGVSFEVTTFRRMDEKENLSLEVDLKYRDFTMNAIAMNRHLEVIDPWKGRDDIKHQSIRCVAHPSARLSEDPLRIIRAFRFVSEMDFEISDETYEALIAKKDLLRSVARERIYAEWLKLLAGKEANKAIDLLAASKVAYELPLFSDQPLLFNLLENNMDYLSDFAVMITYLAWESKQDKVNEWIASWKGSNADKRRVKYFLGLLAILEKDGFTPWLVYQLQLEEELAFSSLCHLIDKNQQDYLEKISSYRDQLIMASRNELAITTVEIIQLFPSYEKGPWIAEMIEAIEYHIIMGKLENNYHHIKEWILCHPPEIS